MKALMTVALLCLLAVGCGKGGGGVPADQARLDTLAAIDEAIRLVSPDARATVERHLSAARDSDSWYEFYLRRGMWYLYSHYPDSMFSVTAAVIRYGEARPPSPRINSLLGYAYEAEATYRQNLRKEVDKAVYWRSKAIAALQQSDAQGSLPYVLSNMGDIYVMTNDLPRAAATYRRALFLADSLSIPAERNITLYTGLASIYMALGDYQETLRLYQKSYAYLDRLNPKMQITLVNNFGNYYYYRGQYEEALAKFMQLKDIVCRTEGEHSYYMYLCKINLSDVQLNLGRLDKAARYVAEADSFFRAEGVTTGIHYATSIKLGIAVRQGRYADVPALLADEHIDGPIDHSLERIRNTYLRDYYLATGNARAAYDNKIEEDRIEDSLAEKRSYMRASEIIQRFSEDTLAMHRQITIAQKDKEKEQAQLTVYALVGAVVILLLVLAVWWQASRRRRMEGEVSLLRLRMENARNRISPHFVFNILNHRMTGTNQQERDELMTLAKLIRRSLDLSHAASTPLAEELRFVADYVDLQRYVLRPDFDFRIACPDGVGGVEVPSMFVQILVENSIKHGLKGLDRPQSLHVTVEDDGRQCVITVEDNGRGFAGGQAARRGTGLSTMFQTIDTLNTRNKRCPMDIDLRNSRNAAGEVTGCVARLTVPRQYRYS